MLFLFRFRAAHTVRITNPDDFKTASGNHIFDIVVSNDTINIRFFCYLLETGQLLFQ